MPNPAEAKRILEAVLLASQEPLGVAELKRLFDDEVGAETLAHLLAELREEWNGRGSSWSAWPAAGGSRPAPSSGRTSSACSPKSRRATPAPSWKPSPSSLTASR